MIHHSENILVILDSIPSMNELVSLCMKINEFSTNINHVFFFLKSQKGGLITFCWAQDMTVVVVNVCGLSQLCHFTPDSFLQMSPLSETTSGTVSEHTRYVSAIYVR